MEILLAYFGCEPHYYDVTSRIKQDVISGTLKKSYTWKQLGDPCEGVKKSLTIIYNKEGKIVVANIPENKAGVMKISI